MGIYSIRSINSRNQKAAHQGILDSDTLLHLRDIQLNMTLHFDILIMGSVDFVLDIVLELSHLS
jgi:hypothetical protein